MAGDPGTRLAELLAADDGGVDLASGAWRRCGRWWCGRRSTRSICLSLVELTHVIALDNHRGRFNLALGVGSAGFSDGMVCAVPKPTLRPRPPETTMRRGRAVFKQVGR